MESEKGFGVRYLSSVLGCKNLYNSLKLPQLSLSSSVERRMFLWKCPESKMN
jgi:hypothetical protein